ncbi:MAG: hypothetical protein WC678_01930 [Parcubacteria group bacterium]|jgi:hypothetical protein
MANYKTLEIQNDSEINSPLHGLSNEDVIKIMKKMGLSFPILYMESKEECPGYLFSNPTTIQIGSHFFKAVFTAVKESTMMALRVFSG